MDTARLETFMDAQCELLGLTLHPDHRPGVLRYLALVQGMAPLVMDFPLQPSDESGNTFVPVSPLASAPAAVPAAPGPVPGAVHREGGIA